MRLQGCFCLKRAEKNTVKNSCVCFDNKICVCACTCIYIYIYVHTVGKESQRGNKSIKSLSMQHLGIMQSALGAAKAFRRSEGLSGSVQDIKSDKPSGPQYQTSREGKLKQGVSSNCRYPHSGKQHRAMQSSGRKKGGRDIWGLIPHPPGMLHPFRTRSPATSAWLPVLLLSS